MGFLIVLNKPVKFVLNRLSKKGFSAFIVGGAVRDVMLQIVPQDFDILTNASLAEISSVFSDQQIKIVGKTFPICMVNGVEVSPSRVNFDTKNFPESDLAKRDLTINAMAYDPVLKKILDPFNGRKDLTDSIIRFTKNPEERIKEDPVRMIRACRFAAMLNGSFSPSTIGHIERYKYLLKDAVAKERIRYEILKAMRLERPSLFFIALQKTGLLQYIFPSLNRCFSLDGGPNHGETVFEHCLLVGDALPANKPILRLAGFLHDSGKFDAARNKNGKLTFIGHETNYHHAVEDLMTLKFSVKQISDIESIIKIHMRPLTDQTTPKAARRLLSKLVELNVDFNDFMRLRIADKKGNLAKKPYQISQIKSRLNIINKEMSDGSVFRMDQLKITGNDIIELRCIKPGPKVGEIKKLLFEKVLENPELNQAESLRSLCQSLKIKK